MILPEIQGQVLLEGNYFYFASDEKYFNKYGKSLFKSLKKHAPWANIHTHIFNPTQLEIDWCNNNQLSVSYEHFDNNFKEINTYYACVRFIRIPQIFKLRSKVISLDTDSIAINPISKKTFSEYTKKSKVLWRQKNKTSLASSVFFGPDDFKIRYANKLEFYFNNDNFKWFLDQDILDEMVDNKEVDITNSNIWGNSKIKKDTLIWTGKGDRKYYEQFQEELKKYD